MEILRASEDYLESMLMMKLKHGYIRSIDVAEHLGVTKPSVTYATRRLKESGHITMDKDGLTKFLIALGVDARTAEEDACKIEHDISQQTYDAICSHARANLQPKR